MLYKQWMQPACTGGDAYIAKEPFFMCCRYSSAAAQKTDWKRAHKLECEPLRSSTKFTAMVPSSIRLAARILWRLHGERVQGHKVNKPESWESFNAIQALENHWERLQDDRRVLFAQMASLTRCSYACAHKKQKVAAPSQD
jgi:hypothetical protein